MGALGGLAGIFDLLNKIGPLLALIQDFMALMDDPEVKAFLDRLKGIFGNKSLTDTEKAVALEALVADLQVQAMALRKK